MVDFWFGIVFGVDFVIYRVEDLVGEIDWCGRGGIEFSFVFVFWDVLGIFN